MKDAGVDAGKGTGGELTHAGLENGPGNRTGHVLRCVVGVSGERFELRGLAGVDHGRTDAHGFLLVRCGLRGRRSFAAANKNPRLKTRM